MAFAKAHSTVALILMVLWITDTPHARADSILFSQIPASTPTGGLGGSQSLHASNWNILSADNFNLNTGAFVTGVQWQGSYNSLPPDNFGLPSSVLQTYTFSGNAGQTFVATDQFGFVLYDYAVILPTPFTVHNGVTNWLSIQAISDLSVGPVVWYWHSGIPTDGRFASTNFGATFQEVYGDGSFALTGTTFFEPSPVPEPSTLFLFGTGLTATLGRWCSKRRKA